MNDTHSAEKLQSLGHSPDEVSHEGYRAPEIMIEGPVLDTIDSLPFKEFSFDLEETFV